MTTPSPGAESGPAFANQSEAEVKEFLVKRDGEGPFSFAGVLLAEAESRSGAFDVVTIRAALYRTRGGKFISSLSKSENHLLLAFQPEHADESKRVGYNKAQLCDTFEQAVRWFRPGPLTDALRQKLGLDRPVRIE